MWVDMAGMTWQMTRRSIPSFPRVVVLLISYQFHIVSIQQEKFTGAPCMPALSSCLVVYTPPRAPCCSCLTCHACTLWWAMAFALKTTVCDSITLTGKSQATHQTLVTGTGWARVTNSQPAPAGTRGINP